jgi:hypothetical protein
MSLSELRTKLLAEIQQVPDDKLGELYDLIHAFQLRFSNGALDQPKTIMQFAGCWSDLPDETYTDFLDDISFRRQQAFSQRQHRETSLD